MHWKKLSSVVAGNKKVLLLIILLKLVFEVFIDVQEKLLVVDCSDASIVLPDDADVSSDTKSSSNKLSWVKIEPVGQDEDGTTAAPDNVSRE